MTAPLRRSFDDFLQRALQNPETRTHYEDAQSRSSLIDVLVKLRKTLGITQTEVARRMGVKQPTVSGFENEGSDPRLSTVQRYARAVEMTVTWNLQSCSWSPRTNGYALNRETHSARFEQTEASPLMYDWAQFTSQRNDFALAS